MKQNRKKTIQAIFPFAICCLLIISLNSCDEDKMNWGRDPSYGEVTTSELPLALAEKISRYEPLKTYTDFTLGAGIGMDLYMNDETYRNIVNENFDEVVVGYAMKHGAMVNSQGELNFAPADAFIAKTKEAGLSVYGHTLVWHQNQNASYLNGLIAPEVIPGPAGTNLLSNGDFEEGDTGWGNWGSGKESVEITTEIKLGGEQALKIVTNSGSSNEWEVQVESPEVGLIVGHRYEIAFYVKSEGQGGVRLSFDSDNPLGNQYPWHLTEGSPVVTSTTWKEVVYSMNTIYSEGSQEDIFKAVASTMKFRLDFGKVANMTYYLDNVRVIDLDAEPMLVNMITNSDFEDGTLDGWTGWGNGSSRDVSGEGEGYGGTGYAMVLTNPVAANNYEAQQIWTFDSPLEQGVDYTCTFMVRATTNAVLQVQIQNADYSGDYYGGINVGTTWIKVEKTITPSTDDKTKFIFDFGETATTYYIDDVVFTSGEPASGSEPIYIEKTPEEKARIIGAAMENWISQMVSHYKNDVHAWDVVNEPMKDDGSLRDGNVSDPATDEFYWVKYLGQDYAVTAFNLARQYGNPDDKLFINDYNLEYNLAKCDGLIEYVSYIEEQGATVDGIGTQMHLSLDSDRDQIDQMFKKLAATGKLIKISEFDIKIGAASPTTGQFAEQADLYQYVLDTYMKDIPEAQRYGVTPWGISDNEQEHVNWIPDDAPNLWDADYERKHAYKGFADGLAGRDVSEDFTGDLQY